MCSAPGCWLAMQGRGLLGGGAHHGPNPSLACRPKRKTSVKDPMFLWGFESCQELVGSGLASGPGNWTWGCPSLVGGEEQGEGGWPQRCPWSLGA